MRFRRLTARGLDPPLVGHSASRQASRSSRSSLGSASLVESTRSRRGLPGKGILLLGLFLAAAGIAGCGENDSDDGWYTLVLVPASGTDPFGDPDAERLYLRIETATFELIAEEEFPLASDDLEMENAPTGRGLYFVVEVRDADVPPGVIAEGRSGPHALEKGEHTTVTVVLEAP